MRLPFLRKSPDREPLIVAMTGARLGERILYYGESMPHLIALAERSGLSGLTMVIAPGGDATRMTEAATRSGVLVEPVEDVPGDATDSCDLAVLDASASRRPAAGWSEVLARLAAALRPGGRLIAVEPGTTQGLLARLSGRTAPPESSLLPAVQATGLTRARLVGDRDGLRFVEALKTGTGT